MRYSANSRNETKALAYIKNMSEVTPPAAVVTPVLGCTRSYSRLVDRIQDFMATKVDLGLCDPKPCSGRPAGSRVVLNKQGEYVLVCP